MTRAAIFLALAIAMLGPGSAFALTIDTRSAATRR